MGGKSQSIREVVHRAEADLSHLSQRGNWRGPEICGKERNGPAGGELRGPGCQPGARLDREESSRGRPNPAGNRVGGGCGGEDVSAPLPRRSAPPSGHVTSPSARSVAVAQRSVSALPPRRPSSPRSVPPPPPLVPRYPARANHRSSSRAPAPPPRSVLSHWLEPQGRVPKAGGNHWWAEPAEFPDEGTFCGIKGARKAGDGAV